MTAVAALRQFASECARSHSHYLTAKRDCKYDRTGDPARRSNVKLSVFRLTAALTLSAALCLPNLANAAGQKVFLIRGFMNVFSPGIDQLASELEQRGIRTEVSNHLSWSSTAAEAIEECKSGKISSIALVGHSLGAAAVVDVAKRLREAGLRVGFMATLDPVAAGQASGNVRRLENYYLSNGIGSAVPTHFPFPRPVPDAPPFPPPPPP